MLESSSFPFPTLRTCEYHFQRRKKREGRRGTRDAGASFTFDTKAHIKNKKREREGGRERVPSFPGASLLTSHPKS